MGGVCCVGSTCKSSTSDECGAIGGDRQTLIWKAKGQKPGWLRDLGVEWEGCTGDRSVRYSLVLTDVWCIVVAPALRICLTARWRSDEAN